MHSAFVRVTSWRRSATLLISALALGIGCTHPIPVRFEVNDSCNFKSYQSYGVLPPSLAGQTLPIPDQQGFEKTFINSIEHEFALKGYDQTILSLADIVLHIQVISSLGTPADSHDRKGPLNNFDDDSITLELIDRVSGIVCRKGSAKGPISSLAIPSKRSKELGLIVWKMLSSLPMRNYFPPSSLPVKPLQEEEV